MSDERALSGSLEAMSLTGLLQLLAAEGRTGRVDVRGVARGGSLWLEAGHLSHAESDDAGPGGPEEALDALIGLSSGTFTFTPGESAPQRSLHGPTEHLLMEAAIRRDHARRGDPAAVAPASVPSFAPVPAGGSTPRFTTLQWRVLASIDGHKSVEAIAADIELPVAALASILADLEAAGVIQIT